MRIAKQVFHAVKYISCIVWRALPLCVSHSLLLKRYEQLHSCILRPQTYLPMQGYGMQYLCVGVYHADNRVWSESLWYGICDTPLTTHSHQVPSSAYTYNII